MNNLFISLNILLLKPGIRLIVNLIVYTVIYITMCPTNMVYAMEQDRENIKRAFEASGAGNEALARRILEYIITIDDPVRIAEMNRIIAELSVLQSIPLDFVHGHETLTIANSGLPPAEDYINWRDVFIRTAIFVSASAIIYLIYRNFHHLTDFFRDVGERAIEMGLVQLNRLGALAIINHSPEAREAFIIEIARYLATVNPRSPGASGG